MVSYFREIYESGKGREGERATKYPRENKRGSEKAIEIVDKRMKGM